MFCVLIVSAAKGVEPAKLEPGKSDVPGKSCALQGRVISSATGLPLSSAGVKLQRSDVLPRGLYDFNYLLAGFSRQKALGDSHQTVTSSDGTFCWPSLEAGRFRLIADIDGFIESDYTKLPPLIDVGAGRSIGIDVGTISLELFSQVSGIALDDTGSPVANINVVAVRRVWFQGQQIVIPVQGAVSDERGAFLITKLAPGEYILYAQPIPTEQTDKDGSSLVRTYYGNTLVATNATPVTLDQGASMRDITIQLQRSATYHVRGSVKGPKDLWRDGAVELRTLNEQPMAIISGMNNIAEDGSFDFQNVSPGLYALTFRSSLAGGTERVEVGSSDVTIDISANIRQTVRATWAQEGSVTNVAKNAPSVELTSVDVLISLPYELHPDNTGTLIAANVLPGRYAIRADPTAESYIKQITVGGKVTEDSLLDLTSAENKAIKIVLGIGRSTLSGNVALPVGPSEEESVRSMQAPKYLILIPEVERVDSGGIIFNSTKTDGSFSLNGLIPGTYYARVVDSIPVNALRDPSVLRRIAKAGDRLVLEPGRNLSVTLRQTPVVW